MQIDNRLDNIRKALLSEMEKSKNTIFSGLLENPLINNIPESIFVNYFLPCFLGNTNNPNWVLEWISIAGSPVAEVGVIKDGFNEILFTVPGILHTNNLFLQKADGDLGDIFTRYDQINANLPMNGLSFLVSALNSKNEEILKNFDMNSVNAKWIQILQRYNVINLSASDNTQQNNSNVSDFFEI